MDDYKSSDVEAFADDAIAQAVVETRDPNVAVAEDVVETAFTESVAEIDRGAGELDDVNRAMDLADGLQRLSLVTSDIQEATPHEAALTQIALEMALAGTGRLPESLAPGLESSIGSKISMEGVGETIARIWQRIMDVIRRVLASIAAFFQRAMGQIAVLKRRAQRIVSRAKAASGQPLESPTVALGSDAYSLAVQGRPPAAVGQIDAALREMTRQGEILFQVYPTAINDTLGKVNEALGDFANGRAQQAVRAVKSGEDIFDPWKMATKFRTSVPFADPRFEPGTAKVVRGLPGGWGLVFVAAGHQGAGMQWVRTVSDAQQPSGTETMATIPAQQCNSLAERVFDMLTFVEKVEGGNFFQNMEKAFGELDRRGKQVMSATEAEKNPQASGAKKVLLGFLSNFTHRTIGPMSQFLGHFIVVCRSAMSVMERSLALHQR